jgi:hypothetical protein
MRLPPKYRTQRPKLTHKRTHTSQAVIVARMLRDLCIMLWRNSRVRRVVGTVVLGLLFTIFCLAVGGTASDTTDVRLTKLERQVRILNEAITTSYGPSASEEARFEEYVRLKKRVTELEKCLCIAEKP